MTRQEQKKYADKRYNFKTDLKNSLGCSKGVNGKMEDIIATCNITEHNIHMPEKIRSVYLCVSTFVYIADDE